MATKEEIKKLRNKVLAGLATVGVAAAAVTYGVGKFVKKNPEKVDKEKGSTELLSSSAHSQKRTLTVFRNDGKDGADFLKENGYSFALSLEQAGHYASGIFPSTSRDVDVVDKNNRCVAVADVLFDKENNIQKIIAIEVLDGSSALMDLIQSQNHWQKLGERSISLLENESIAEAKTRLRKQRQEEEKLIPVHKFGGKLR